MTADWYYMKENVHYFIDFTVSWFVCIHIIHIKNFMANIQRFTTE